MSADGNNQLLLGGGRGGRHSKIKLNVLPTLMHFPLETSLLHRSRESRFSSKLIVSPDSRENLRVYTYPNEICLLTLSDMADAFNIKSVEFLVDVTDESISGKKKKGAVLIKAGQRIAVIHNIDGSDFTVSTPIGGFLLEINSKLVSESGVSLLLSDKIGSGYIAVVKPNTQFPSSDFPTHSHLVAHLAERQERVCFSWKSNGTCQYGDSCKFKHPSGASYNSISSIVTSSSSVKVVSEHEESSCTIKRKIDDL